MALFPGFLCPCVHVLLSPQLFFKSFSAYVHYPDDDSYEELDLKELIRDKHVAIGEPPIRLSIWY